MALARPTRDRRALLAALLASICVQLHAVPAAARDKTDIVIMRNGDRLTGEVKGLEYGILELSTDHMGTVKIEWPEIASIESMIAFDVEQIGGMRSHGAITTANGKLMIANGEAEPESVSLASVTRLSELQPGFWQRVNGTFSIGYNYTKSSDISVTNFALTSQYVAERIRSTLDINGNRTSSPGQEATDQESIQSTVQFLSDKPRFWVLLNTLESNEQLGIERRLQSGGAIARYFKQTAYSELTGYGGLAVNAERTTTALDDRQTSVEGVLGGQWRVFRFTEPEVSLTAQAALYPSITEQGRYRSSLNMTMARDLIKDFTINLTLYQSYDSDPPAEANGEINKKDYGIVTSFGYKF
ncbi:MAG TPA: DUF481 domain-containing protein [Gammaproteobacteria bacterium]|nr:DUF481 domain-containing protein [Gammaproteobacteria bacterium]